MALKYEVDSVEGLDDGVKSLYTEIDGKFRLSVEGAPDVGDLQTQLTALQNKNTELLTETKTAKTAKRQAEEAAQEAAKKAAEENGDFKSLYESLNEKHTGLENSYNDLKGNIAKEQRNNEAMKIATSLADGANAKLLSRFIAERLKPTEEGIKVTDLNGGITVSSLDDLANEFKNNPEFSSLIKGIQSSGGGAGGGGTGGGAAKTMTRADFDALDPIAQAKFVRGGGKPI